METEHIVKSFDADLRQIQDMILEMGELVENQIKIAAKALKHRDHDRASQVIANDEEINRREREVDRLAIRILALRQPMAEDLRSVIAGLKIAGNLERIGDYAKNIATRTNTLADQPKVASSGTSLKSMSKLVREMIKFALNAYVTHDRKVLETVYEQDEEVDQMNDALFRELLTYMMEDQRNITACMHLLFVAKSIERMGDHVKNMAEQVHFMIFGDLTEDSAGVTDPSPGATG